MRNTVHIISIGTSKNFASGLLVHPLWALRIEELSFGLRFHLFNSIYYFMPIPTFHFDYELNI